MATHTIDVEVYVGGQLISSWQPRLATNDIEIDKYGSIGCN